LIPYKVIKKSKMKIFLSAAIVCLCTFQVWSQNQDPNSPGFDFNLTTDSTITESSETPTEGQPEAAPAKPYERITLYIDTLTNLIVYTGVVEQEESSSDSIYVRAKNFANKHFTGGAKEVKGLFEVDKKNQKLVINAVLPAYSYANKYAKKPIGTYQFKMTLLIKEGRYKYVITNLVHEGTKPNVGVPSRNYFEYYYNTMTNIKGVDQILRYADKDINAMLEGFKKSLREPVVLDEDEW
jgi:hypothetical protein